MVGGTEGDPSDIRHTWQDGDTVGDRWPEGTTWLDVLISLVNRHAGEAADRIRAKAEKNVVAAAEQTVRDARQEQLKAVSRRKGPLATPQRVDRILSLLTRRAYSGEGGGFFIGPTDRAGIEELSQADAWSYIASLKGDY